jgi:hypothetical protein
MYADDHDPPHVHVRGGGYSAVINLDTLQVTRGWIRGRELDEIVAYLGANMQVVRAKWSELNERD